jgi:hypothetical protein
MNRYVSAGKYHRCFPADKVAEPFLARPSLGHLAFNSVKSPLVVILLAGTGGFAVLSKDQVLTCLLF